MFQKSPKFKSMLKYLVKIWQSWSPSISTLGLDQAKRFLQIEEIWADQRQLCPHSVPILILDPVCRLLSNFMWLMEKYCFTKVWQKINPMTMEKIFGNVKNQVWKVSQHWLLGLWINLFLLAVGTDKLQLMYSQRQA